MKFDSLVNYLLSESRKYIDWDLNYGKSFKLVHTPEGKQSSETKWTPDLISIVTPENGDAWSEWIEVDADTLLKWKDKWNNIQKSLGDHKYNQIIRSSKTNITEQFIKDIPATFK